LEPNVPQVLGGASQPPAASSNAHRPTPSTQHPALSTKLCAHHSPLTLTNTALPPAGSRQGQEQQRAEAGGRAAATRNALRGRFFGGDPPPLVFFFSDKGVKCMNAHRRCQPRAGRWSWARRRHICARARSGIGARRERARGSQLMRPCKSRIYRLFVFAAFCFSVIFGSVSPVRKVTARSTR
jgi:hypothetical protein